MLYIPYGYVRNNQQVQINLSSDYEESQYYKEVPYITNQGPAVENNLLNLSRNREDLKNGYWQLVIMVTKCKKILMQQQVMMKNLTMLL